MQRARAAWRAVSLPTCRLAVTVSSEIFDEVRRRTSTRTVLIPNGIDIDSARWCGDEDVVLVMGGTGARKDESTAVRAWAALRREVRGDTRCEVIGVAPELRRRELIALAASLGVATSVDIVGVLPRDAFLERVSRARIAISCSLLEAFGLPVGEAIALGAPTLCSDIPAHVEILERAAAGASFRAGNPAALADQIERALQHVPPARLLAAPLGWGWRARASEHIDAYMESTSIPSGAETITDGSNHAERSTLHERRS